MSAPCSGDSFTTLHCSRWVKWVNILCGSRKQNQELCLLTTGFAVLCLVLHIWFLLSWISILLPAQQHSFHNRDSSYLLLSKSKPQQEVVNFKCHMLKNHFLWLLRALHSLGGCTRGGQLVLLLPSFKETRLHVAKLTTLPAGLNALCPCQALRGHLADHDLQGYNWFVISK